MPIAPGEPPEYMRPEMRKPRRNGAPPTTDTDTPEIVAHDFELLPRAVSDACRSGELDFNEHGLLTFLIGDIDWQTHEWRGSLAGLKGLSGWPRSEDWLRKTLIFLREEKWISYDMKRGERNYVIRLGARLHEALYGEQDPTKIRLSKPSESDLSSDKDQSESPANAVIDGARANPKDRIDPSPYTRRYETETKRDFRDSSNERVGNETLPAEGAA
jgi:hypothetical protein